MAVSYHKYGPVVKDTPTGLMLWNRSGCGSSAIWKQETQSSELNAADLCMIEFMHPRLEGAHFEPTDQGNIRSGDSFGKH